MKRRALVAFAALLFFSRAPLAAQTTYIVNSTTDPGNGVCDIAECTLREAINAANSNPGADIIEFNISGPGPHTIQPGFALPSMSDPVVIDGYTQSGASANTNPLGQAINATLMIVLDGSGAGAVSGLTITATGCTVRGLVINQFGNHGIHISGAGASGNLVAGNFIGTDANGTTDLGNIDDGVFIESGPTNTVGGTTAASRNLVSGNGLKGIDISNATASGNVVQGNYIGTDANGTAAIGNDEHGISIADAPSNTIGGTAAGAGNVVSGNALHGIEIIFGNATDNTVQGNYIGTDVSGTVALSNGEQGVVIADAPSNTIGGTTGGARNVISGNTGNGVWIDGTGASGNLVAGNSIFSNGGLGIDLGADGLTANDAGDGDTGANDLQNFPSLTSALRGSTTLEGAVNSTPATDFRVEFFSNSECDPSGNGEGETFLDATTVTTDANGDASFTVTLASTVSDPYITATATGPNNNTSEFSKCVAVLTDFTVAASPTSVTVTRGSAATYTVTISPIGAALDDAVSLSCSDLPNLTSCSFSPSAVTPGGNDATSTLTVTTTAPSASLIAPLDRHAPAPAYALWQGLLWLALPGLGLVGVIVGKPASQPRRHGLLLAVLLALLGTTISGACAGAEEGINGPTPGTTTGTFTITITGTAGILEHATTATLIVQ
jgi:CSLREA domain-containing protein